MTNQSRNRRIKPTIETEFHIDYDWWARDERDLHVYLLSHLPPEQQAYFSEQQEDTTIDWIDPQTAEVKKMDGIQVALQDASQSENFISQQTSLVDAVFRVFLANGNQPLTPLELGEKINRQPRMILRTLSGTRVYKGLRPITEKDQP